MGSDARARCPFLWLVGLLQVGYLMLTGVTITFPAHVHAAAFSGTGSCPYMSAARGVGSALGLGGGGASQAVRRLVGGQTYPYPLLPMPRSVPVPLGMRGGRTDGFDHWQGQGQEQGQGQGGGSSWQQGKGRGRSRGHREGAGQSSGVPGRRSVAMHVGISHKDAAVGLREKLATSEEQVNVLAAELVDGSGGSVQEALVLSTCNRFEIYTATTDPARAAEHVYRVLAGRTDKAASTSGAVPVELLRRTMRVVVGEADVATHLFRVASGLDSIVLGEPQVLGQVKGAWERASDAGKGGRAGRVLGKLFGAAFRTVGRVRSETALSRGSMSVSSTAAGFANGRLVADTGIPGGMAKARVVVVGSGKMARLLVQNLALQGVQAVTVVCRSAAKVQELQREVAGAGLQLRHRPMAELTAAMAEADVLFPCTSAPEPIVTPDMLRRALLGPMRVPNPLLASMGGTCTASSSSGGGCGAGRPRRGSDAGRDDGTVAQGTGKGKASLQIVDISVPRNVHADVSALAPGGSDPAAGLVASYNVDDLKSIMAANAAMRAGEVRHAEGIIAAEVAAYSASAGAGGGGGGCSGPRCGSGRGSGAGAGGRRDQFALRAAVAAPA